MSKTEKGLFSGLFRALREIRVEYSAPDLGSLPPLRLPENNTPWRRSLTRREVGAWLLGPAIPLAAILYAASRIDLDIHYRQRLPVTPGPTPQPAHTPIPAAGASPTTTGFKP